MVEEEWAWPEANSGWAPGSVYSQHATKFEGLHTVCVCVCVCVCVYDYEDRQTRTPTRPHNKMRPRSDP